MLFCGDFVFPHSYNSSTFQGLGEEFINEPKLLNFESTLKFLNREKVTNGIALYSDVAVLNILKYLNVQCVSLANNHIGDFTFDPEDFITTFVKNEIHTLGFGKNIEQASLPFINHTERMIVLSFGWEVIRCKLAGKSKMGINPYRYEWVEQQVDLYKKKFPTYKLILFLHWNYEFENLPHPADRKFSHYLIDKGVDGIFGHHPHIINSVEVYNGKVIFYSLGNFYFPQGKYGSYYVKFRKEALYGISVLYTGQLEHLRIYYHKQQIDGKEIKLERTFTLEEFFASGICANINGLSDSDYINFYKQNHFHRRKLLPIYKDFTKSSLNRCLNKWVKIRQLPIDILSKCLYAKRKN